MLRAWVSVVIAAGVAAPAIALAEPTDKNDKSDNAKPAAKSGDGEKSSKSSKSTKSEDSEKSKSSKSSKAESSEKAKATKSDSSERSTKSEGSGKSAKSDSSERSTKSEGSGKSAKSEASEKSSKVAKSEKSEKSERSARSEKSTKKAEGSEKRKKSKSEKTASGKKRNGKGKSANARLTTQKFRGPMRTDNGPAGFSWPPTPQMIAAEKACEERLDLAGVPWRSVEGDGHMADAVVIDGGIKLGGVAYTNVWGGKGPYKLDCQLAVALETVGTELYAIGVREVRFGSIYSWRRIHAFGKTSNMLTRHALGLAMDIAEFVDDKGRVASVLAHYAKGDALLHAIEDTINNSHRFRVLLSPKNDPVSHSNHFHIEAASDFFAKPE